MGNKDIQLSDAEKRLLRKVFHRHALPYLGLMAVVTAVALSGGGDEQKTPPVAAPSGELSALEKARSDADGLVAELRAAAEQQKQATVAAAEELASLDARIASASSKLKDLDSRTRKAQKTLEKVASAPAPEAAPQASAILERLSNLEVRQEKLEADRQLVAGRAGSNGDILDRLAKLEQATGVARNAVSGSSSPASPSPFGTP